MAAAKKAAPKNAPKGKKSTGTAMTVFEERLREKAKLATAIESNVGGGGQFISLKGGHLTFQGATVPGNKMNVIVVDHIIEYAYFGNRYDPDSPANPMAFAFGRDENEMRWHENSVEEIDGEPIRGELCKDSFINSWGSADTGSGKAAKNLRRLALLTEDQIEDVESIEGAQVTYLKVPVTSVKGWAGYVRQLDSAYERPPLAFVTEISVVPDPKTQFKLQFKLVEAIEDGDILGALLDKQEVVEKEIDFPYAPYDEEAEDERPQRGRGRGGKPAPRGGKPNRAAKSDDRPATRGRAAREEAPPARGRGAAAKAPAKRKY